MSGLYTAVVAALRTVFASIFTAAFTAIYTNELPIELQRKLVPAVINAGFPASSIDQLVSIATSSNQPAIASLPGMNSSIIIMANNAIADSYAAAYSYIYYFAIALGCIAIIASASCKDFDHFLNDHVPHQIYHRRDTEIDPLECESDNTSETRE